MPERKPREFPIEDFKVSIDTTKKIGMGAVGIVYRGRITRPARSGERRFSIPVAIKTFRPAREVQSPLVGWDEKRQIFTNYSFGEKDLDLPDSLAPKANVEDFQRVIDVLMRLKKKWRKEGLPVVVPRQAILPGDPQHPQEELRKPHIISELFLRPGEKRYVTGKSQAAELLQMQQVSKEVPVSALLAAQGFLDLDKLKDYYKTKMPHLVKPTIRVLLDLAREGLGYDGDVIGLLELKSESKLVVRDVDSLVWSMNELKNGHSTPILDAADYLNLLLAAVPESERRQELARVRRTLRHPKMPPDFRNILTKRLKLVKK